MSRLQDYQKFIAISMLVSFTLLTLMNYNQKFTIENKHRRINLRDLRWLLGDDDDDVHRPHSLHFRPVKTRTQYPITVNTRYIINNPDICRRFDRVSVLVMVHTAPDHCWRRQEMRRTWLNRTHYSPENVLVIFLLGTVKSSSLQSDIYRESEMYEDIIQGDFVDSYRNLTNKGVMGYRWITENCRNAEIVIKIDDDAFINMFKLFEEFSSLKERRKFIFCNKISKNSMPILRDAKSKWFVAEDEYKSIKLFPHTYCSGFVVFLSIDLVPSLYHAAIATPFFWVDDFFLFGLLPSKVPGVVFEPFHKNLTFKHPEGLECYQKNGTNCQYLIMPAKDKEIAVMWREITKDRKQSKFGNYYMKLKMDSQYRRNIYSMKYL